MRALALDALRGLTILAMVLSGSMLMENLPAWMAHAQVPPGKGFDPSIYGITWVDLVFPFFLFAMGAAFPFSIGRKLEQGEGRAKAVFNTLLRGVQLTFFAIFIQHMYPYVVSNPQDVFSWILALFAFILMFPMFGSFPQIKSRNVQWTIKITAFIIAFAIMQITPYHSDRLFNPEFSNIIILVLANMAFFGGIIYIFTKSNKLLRIAILPFIMAIFLGSENEGWQKIIYEFTPIPWAYKFYYLKYLFIIIPGSIAGDYLYSWINSSAKEIIFPGNKTNTIILATLSILLIVNNVLFLFTRCLVSNLLVSIGILSAMYYLLKNRRDANYLLWKRLFIAGAYFLLLGLAFESYEGGIRKDHSTYSYYFVTSGLAFFSLIFFSIVCDYFKCIRSTKVLVMCGQNPMIAYVGASLVVFPVLKLVGLYKHFDVFAGSAFGGFLHGIIITSLVACITIFFTKIKWFWRT